MTTLAFAVAPSRERPRARVAFQAAAALGWLSRRGWDRSIRSAIGAMFVGEVVLYAIAIPWLMGAIEVRLDKALELGLAPFVIGDALKLLLAAFLLPGAWKLLGGRRSS